MQVMPAETAMPVLLTCPEFAAALRVEDSTAYRWARDGVVSSVRVGGVVRIPAGELERIAGAAAAHERQEKP
jgi:excisionase family DNA binding protein